MTIAVIKTGGKQYKVEVGDIIKVEKIESINSELEGRKKGEISPSIKATDDKQKLEFEDILHGKKVITEVAGEGKHKKIRVFKFRPKKRYQRTSGHRQKFTELEIKKIE